MNFEKLGVFYLGKSYDRDQAAPRDELLLYDSKDLTTHAVCVGMTGSGKTGLCLSLLEEAAIDQIPAIAIDPKGDLGNLLLTFPELRADDFQPWVDPGAATRAGLSPEAFATQTAKQWREGLAAWGQAPERIAKFRDAVDLAIYTPGSGAGLPLTVLKSFAAPPKAVLDDRDALSEQISSATSGLLALLGITADPVRSREHILIANLFDRAWRSGRDLDLVSLIHQIQQPPIDKVGIIDLETFFPAGDRMTLSMSLNSLLASPSFASWMEGEPLDVKRLLHTPEGKPRLSIVSIAHLSESERMFFVTILLNEVLAWMRSQPGTSSLRALLYMDEVFGYFPPTENPPSKRPMLTLLKQARAYGLGVVLATQNPVDLDYKGLSNTGTWFLGRLQTERDKARVLEGLEGASVQAGAKFDRQQMEATLAGLDSRVFLMNNVHDDEPVVFQTRWALSYLRGPLTRTQIETLMASKKALLHQQESSVDQSTNTAAAPAAAIKPEPAADTAPVVPPGIDVCYLPVEGRIGADHRLVYRPALLGCARLHFVRATWQVDVWREQALLVPVNDEVPDSPWTLADFVVDASIDVEPEPDSPATFAPLAAKLTRAKQYASWSKQLKDHLYRTSEVAVRKCSELKQFSEPDETEGDFRARLAHFARERRDLEVEKLKKSYGKKLATLKDRIRAAEAAVGRERSQFHRAATDSVISFGSSILGALFGRKLGSVTNVGRASTSMRSAGRAAQQRGDIGRAEEKLEALKEQLEQLEKEFEQTVDDTEEAYQADQLELDQLAVSPRKTDIDVHQLALAWTPWRVSPTTGIAEPAFTMLDGSRRTS